MIAISCSKITHMYFNAPAPEGNVSFDPFNKDILGTVNISCVDNSEMKAKHSLYYLYANSYIGYANPLPSDEVSIARYQVDSFIELIVSRVAHHIFPQNFPKYSLFYEETDKKIQIGTVGYIVENIQKELDHKQLVAGAENVYAVTFYLGLEVRGPVYELNGNLYINDFSHPFHNINQNDKSLIDEYRDHKISFSEDGTLFPQSFINSNCSRWFGGTKCDINKLQEAYKVIANTSITELQNIVDHVVDIYKEFGENYQEVGCEIKSILTGNIDIIQDFLEN